MAVELGVTEKWCCWGDVRAMLFDFGRDKGVVAGRAQQLTVTGVAYTKMVNILHACAKRYIR